MANELVLPANVVPSQYASDEQFSQLASGGSFLARLQLFGSNSDACKEGKIGIGVYGLVISKEEIEDLTKEVDVFVLSWRPKALDMSDRDNPISFYDPKDQKFKDIQQKSEIPNSGATFGPEFLVYVPSIGKYATFFMGSKTARRVAPDLKTLMGKAATLKSQLIKTKQYSWHGPIVTICSSPLASPPVEEMVDVINTFNNPPKTEVEAAPPDSESRG